MRRARPILTLLLLLPLTACYSDQQKQLVSCEADATFPTGTPGQPFKAIQACMEKNGYRFIGWNDGVVCDMASVIRGRRGPTGGDVLCFEPAGWLARKLYRLEVPEKNQTAPAT